MYSPEERELTFRKVIENLNNIQLIDGVVQLGSGVRGYKDRYSDIDLMVSVLNAEDVEAAKNRILKEFVQADSTYIKELILRTNIFLLIVILKNGLEINMSILPTSFLNVKSPLWKVIVDKTGRVTEFMERENQIFTEKRVKYSLSDDIGFEFFYSMRKFQTELRRDNLIFALQMLEKMRSFTLEVQAINEGQKLHQFKAYETLKPEFIKGYINTFPIEITEKELTLSAEKLEELFRKTVNESSVYTIDESVMKLLGGEVV